MSNSPTHSETTRRSLLRSAVGASVAASAGFAGAATAREEGADLDDVGPEKADLGAPERGAVAQTDSGEGSEETGGGSGESGEGSGTGGHSEGSGIEIQPGVVPMFLAGVAAFFSPLVFAVLLFLNRDDDEHPSERGEIEYRPGTEH